MDNYRLYNVAYKHLLYSIHFGFYPPGSSLPSVPQLCRAFGVSHTTIHSALKMLQDEQYISRNRGRSAIVTYNAQSGACREKYLAYCQSTKDAVLDLSGILWMLWPEIVLQGLRLCGERDLEELSEIAAGAEQCAEYPYMYFTYRIVQHLGNPLLLNLYLSTVLFGHCSPLSLGDAAAREAYMIQLREVSAQILALRRSQNYRQLKELLTRYYGGRTEGVRVFYDALPISSSSVEPVPYRWNYYTERPSVGFNLAMKLLREIYASYRPMDYLPSVATLSKQYDLPVITVRRAVQILNDIGIAENVNGKGTRVTVGSGVTVHVSRLSTPNMKKVLMPYLQSVQAILLICGDVARAVFPTLQDSAIEAAAKWLREILASGDYFKAFGAAFKLLLTSTQSPALKEILGGLMYYQYLGYPLMDMKPNAFRYDPHSTQVLLRSLENRDAELFAGELQALMRDIFQVGKEKLLTGGVTEADSVATPLFEG